MATMKFNTYMRESKRKPVPLELPDGSTLIVPIPNGDEMMDIEEAGITRRALRLALGDENFRRIQPLFKEMKDPDALREFTLDLMRNLGVSPDDRPPADGSPSSS